VRPEIRIAPAETLAEALAARLEEAAAEAIAGRGRFTIALPGGSAARQFFPRLARARVDWTRTDFFWSDERAVPPDDPESNYLLAQRLWLGPIAVPQANIHRLPAELPDLEAAAAAAEKELLDSLGDPPGLDWLWLGVGPDGHVASLFPGQPLLGEWVRFVAPVYDSPKPPAARLTFTLPTVAAARFLVVTALGSGKASALATALRDPDSRLPLALALAAAERSWLLLDPAAAEGVPPSLREIQP
jgi:6-phosphogluconolactonase